MAKFITYCYEIKLLSNMHVGSGDATFGIIDKLVQRDPVTQYPTIHASSLKGALREFFTKEKGHTDIVYKDEKEEEKPDPFILCVFGSNPKEKKRLKNGEFRFFSADLFLLPVRSSHRQFYLATKPEIAGNLVEKCNLLDVNDKERNAFLKDLDLLTKIEINKKSVTTDVENPSDAIIIDGDKTTILEDFHVTQLESVSPEIKAFNKNDYDNKLAIFGEKFGELAQNLPVIARNNLEDGRSANLWYEEIVPHQTRFITFVSIPDTKEAINHFDTFNKDLTESVIQIGANSSIGYGLCEFKLLN